MKERGLAVGALRALRFKGGTQPRRVKLNICYFGAVSALSPFVTLTFSKMMGKKQEKTGKGRNEVREGRGPGAEEPSGRARTQEGIRDRGEPRGVQKLWTR